MIFLDYPGHLVAALLLITAAALLIVAFKIKEVRKAKYFRLLLWLLQYTVIAILLLVLWNPSRPKPTQTTSRNSVLVFFDTSQSMSIVEGRPKTRLQKALDIFEQNFNASDPEGCNYKIYAFDHKTRPASLDFSQLSTWGRQTNLHSVFEFLRTKETAQITQPLKKGKVIGAVVFTDGQADEKNVNAYLPLTNNDLDVILLGVGSKEAQSDIAVKSIKTPSRVAVNTAYTIDVVAEATNLQNNTITIELAKDDYIIAAKQFDIASDTMQIKCQFTVGANKLGRQSLLVKAKTTSREANLANNARSMMVDIVENARLKVLLYSQVASMDIGKVRQALARDSKIELDLGMDAILKSTLAKKTRAMCGHVELPANRTGFYKYDVVILGPCEIDWLTKEQKEGLYSFVVDRGGGLIILPGRDNYGPAEWEDPKIKTLLPVLFEDSKRSRRDAERGKMQLTLVLCFLDNSG